MTGTHPHAVRLVRAVHEIALPLKRERMAAERVVRTRPDYGRKLIAVLRVFLANRHRDRPHRIQRALDDLGRALRRLPSHAPDADRVRDHFGRLILLVRREVEEAHRWNVDDDAFAGRIGQYEARRHHDLAPLARQPRIDAGIGAHDFLVTEIEAARDIRKRVFLGGNRALNEANHIVVERIDLESMCRYRRQRGRFRRPLLHGRLLLRHARTDWKTANSRRGWPSQAATSNSEPPWDCLRVQTDSTDACCDYGIAVCDLRACFKGVPADREVHCDRAAGAEKAGQ